METTFSGYSWPKHLPYYTEPKHTQFVYDMLEAGLFPWHYSSRKGYNGPAVDTNKISKVLIHTRVHSIWDSFGKVFIVYPK